MAEIKVFENKDKLAEAAAIRTIEIIKYAINSQGYAIWVLAGGSTPASAYKYIAQNLKEAVDWSKVYFLIGDERSVAIDDVLSNYHEIKEDLLDNLSVDQEKVVIPNYSGDNKSDAKDYDVKVSALYSELVSQVDVLWLGIGEDGHTLSLFPDSNDIDNLNDYVLAISNSPKPPSNRISLSLKALNNVANCLVLISGDSKKEVYGKINSSPELPINKVVSHVEHKGARVEWLVSSEVIN